MKKVLFLGILAFSLVLASCGGKEKSPQKKEIPPTQTEFSEGQIGNYIEVVDEPCELTYIVHEGYIEEQVFQLKVKIKLTKSDPMFKDMNPRDFMGGGASIELQDELGTKIQELTSKDYDLVLGKLLKGEVGDTATIVFQEEFHNSDDAPKWFKNTVKFAPITTGRIVSIGEPIENGMEINDGTSDTSLDETASSADVDEMLNSYEEFVDQYISYLKKAANGDMSALAEYPSLMSKAQEVGEKIEAVKGDLTPSQSQRYMEIMQKMTKAASEMQ